MLTIIELRRLSSLLSREQFEQQLGPFALVQRPPDPKVQAQDSSSRHRAR